MTRFFLVFAVLALTAVLSACNRGDDGPESTPTASSAHATPMNVLLITLDTVRADALGAYGQTRVTTPHIDAFADEGVLFENCVSSSPSTLPSHSSIFTGRHPYAHGVRANAGYALGESELTLAETLRSHGYRTRAEIAAQVLAPKTRIDQGFESFHGVEADDVELPKIRESEGDWQRDSVLMVRPAADISRHGTRFLETVKPLGRPFFLWLHYFDAHRPHVPPPRFRDRFPDDLYLASISAIDDAIGDILTALIRLGLADNTLVVITSDHGEGRGEHGEETHMHFLYDTTIRIPLIMRGPGLDKGKRVTPLVRSVDIAPTILDALNLPALPTAQGVSLGGLMAGRETPPLIGYGESIELLKAFASPILRFVRRGNWKYIHTSPAELYDLAADPSELDNAATREPERTEELRALLRELLSDATGPPEGSLVDVDAEEQARLEALGYLAGLPPTLPDELASLALDDPPEGYSPAAEIMELAWASGDASSGRYDKAVERYRQLWSRHPRSAELLRRLVKSLSLLKDPEASPPGELVDLYQRALEVDADNVEIFLQLAALSVRAGSLEDAVQALGLALELDPCAGSPRSTLVNLYFRAQRYYEQFEAARQGVLQCPALPSALNDMAWVFATSRVDDLRDGSQAVFLAERALAAEPDKPGYLDTLAAAHAEMGEYERAAAIVSEIIPALERVNAPATAIAEFEKHLAEFEAGRPLRE